MSSEVAAADCLFLGIDIGTSGVRGSLIGDEREELFSYQIDLEAPKIKGARTEQNPLIWKQATFKVIKALQQKLQNCSDEKTIAALAIDGTSGTVLVCDQTGTPLANALMYNDQSCLEEAAQIAEIAPADCAAHGASSSLAKAMFLLKHHPEASHLCHQADWVAATLTGKYGISDENNCLKLGYNSLEETWPNWLNELDIGNRTLPRVLKPGSLIANINPKAASELGLTESCQIIAGTTDSIAAFIATGANKIGDAVTSLGSTLVLKIIADKPVFAPEFGIYSHRLGEHWLAGGASNSGGCVLKKYFNQQQLDAMTPLLKAEQKTGLDYYPLPSTGERFPRNDANLAPKLEPRPDDDVSFFQAILEGIANIEAEGYQQLSKLGAPAPQRVFTAGGGSKNSAWRQIRQTTLNTPVIIAGQTEASYGSALLARQGYMKTIEENAT
ncbi:MAG: FGGY-family carbohydrate kinase [Gammaproteobacteria bacterium]|nr:FGGY-family carbohydrate kinase [Gammaproteobacteria bacterium]